MTFTRRTYRVAIRRSMAIEEHFRYLAKRARNTNEWIGIRTQMHEQTAHTARLQRRKRRERK